MLFAGRTAWGKLGKNRGETYEKQKTYELNKATPILLYNRYYGDKIYLLIFIILGEFPKLSHNSLFTYGVYTNETYIVYGRLPTDRASSSLLSHFLLPIGADLSIPDIGVVGIWVKGSDFSIKVKKETIQN